MGISFHWAIYLAIHMEKQNIVMAKPIYIRISILDLSKLLMQDYFYNDPKDEYNYTVDVLYLDTDRFILVIKTKYVYKGHVKNKDKYDTREYYTRNTHYTLSNNKNVLGK